MSIQKVKIGDTVRRIRGGHNGMAPGNTATVTRVILLGMHVNSLGLQEFPVGRHDAANFELVTTGPEEEMPADAVMSADPRVTVRGNYLGPVTYKSNNLHCCGVKEYHGLQGQLVSEYNWKGVFVKHHKPTPMDILKGMCKYWREVSVVEGTLMRARPFMVFTVARSPNANEDNPHYTVGKDVAKLIAEHNLGSVWMSEWEMNGNSGNFVQMYVWTINREVVEKAFKDAQHP